MKIKGYVRLAGGGSSVLVVFLMLLLITLGVMALASSNAGLRLAEKGAAWTKDYYLLEAGGETLIELVSQSLHQTAKTVSAEGYSDEAYANSYFRQCLSHCLGHGGKNLPYETEITEWNLEAEPTGLVLLTAWLTRKHQSRHQCLLVEIQVCTVSDKSNTGSFRILQWKQYQEPMDYEPEFNLLQ
ncbi:MAG: hypothetical protein ACOX4K_01455 [Bacillota bacterium]